MSSLSYDPSKVGVVLSGGGVRGAYEVGVIKGIVEILGKKADDPPPFRIFTGTSVGAINAAYLAAHAHRGDLEIRHLVDLWTGLRIHTHLRPDLLHFLGILRSKRHAKSPAELAQHLGRSLLEPGPLEDLVQNGVPWRQLQENIDNDALRGLVIAALEIGTGRTTLFAHVAKRHGFEPTRDPRRCARIEPITADHVLASAAIPVIFPARRIGQQYYCDGGLRFNTPIAPAIRLGAERLVVISLRHESTLDESALSRLSRTSGADRYPSVLFLLGKLLNAMLLDPVVYDLQVMKRFNTIVESLEEVLTKDEMDRFQDVVIASRGMPYHKMSTLVFAPSQDIGVMAGAALRRLTIQNYGRLGRWIAGKFEDAQGVWEADWASYLLFDGDFAHNLIQMGLNDTLAKADEVRTFFKARNTEPED